MTILIVSGCAVLYIAAAGFTAGYMRQPMIDNEMSHRPDLPDYRNIRDAEFNAVLCSTVWPLTIVALLIVAFAQCFFTVGKKLQKRERLPKAKARRLP